MKRAFLFCCVMSCMMMLSCVKNTKQLEDIQSGDIIFVSLPMNYSLIDSVVVNDTSSEKNFIHVAVADVDEDGKLWVIDATLKHGVDRHPVDTFFNDFTLRNGELPNMEVWRLKDCSDMGIYMENIKQYIGEEYDMNFMMDNGKHYCSELIYDAYLKDGEHVFELGEVVMRNSKGTVPIYWIQLFDKISMPLPQGKVGIMPQQMYDGGKLRKVNVKFP